MLTEFIDRLNSISPMSVEATKYIQKIITLQRLPKWSILLVEGQVSDKLFFLCDGMARAFYYENGEEKTSWVVSQNDFFYSTASFIHQKPSFENIQLLEDSVVISVDKKEIDNLFQKFPETTYVSMRITEKHLLLHDERVRSLRLSARDRYSRFQEQYPYIASKVKIQYIASYLGLSHSHLSHLRMKK
jgi:CRP/FNR family transcriptional regulator, anaerobic regulatory protein